MSAKVNVLASLRDAKECLINAGIDHHDLTLSIAAIAELIAADREYDAAAAEMCDTSGYVFPIGSGRLLKAKQRRAAALAAVAAQSAGSVTGEVG